MQAELFNMSGPVVDASKVSKPQSGWLDHIRVTLRLDHLLIVGISALVLYVLVFSFGVEKGKRYAIDEVRAERAKQEQISKELAQPEVRATLAVVSAPSEEKVSVPEDEKRREGPAGGHYTIQLIAFTSQRLAEKKVEDLKKKGYQGFIIPRGKFFQVCADAFQNMDEAREKLIQLRAEGFAAADAYIRPLSGLITV